MAIKTFAAIDVGSFELTMKVYEMNGKSPLRRIDRISRRLDLGADTFADGKISNEKMDELCKTLKEFDKIMKAYRVDAYQAYGTSAIRETENMTIVLDQIEQRTGIRVEPLSNSEQRFLGYKSIAARGEEFQKTIEEKTAILDIGGGSIQISLFDNDTLVSTQNILLGVLRIQEYIHRFDVKPSAVEDFIVEMAMAQLGSYKKLYLKDRTIQTLIVIDDYVSPLAQRLPSFEKGGTVEYSVFYELIRELRESGSAKIGTKYGISEDKMSLASISAVLTDCIAKLMGATKIWISGATLCDGIAYDYAESQNLFKGNHDFEQDIIACAKNISKRYMGSRKRSETLENISGTIFDSLKKVHGLGKRERLYLQLAAILHDCGRYISMTNLGENSYNIIMATEMIGLSHTERVIVASVARFYHSKFQYDNPAGIGEGLDRAGYLTVAKLTAILRLAAGLDRSHKQKLIGLKAAWKEKQLILSVDTTADITMERGFFEETKEFFVEVFHIEPILKQRKVY